MKLNMYSIQLIQYKVFYVTKIEREVESFLYPKANLFTSLIIVVFDAFGKSCNSNEYLLSLNNACDEKELRAPIPKIINIRIGSIRTLTFHLVKNKHFL